MHDFLAEKHKGMRVDHSGILGRISKGCTVRPDQRYILGEMDKQLEEMAKRFYSGDIKAVDEFLQLYCLDKHRPDKEDTICMIVETGVGQKTAKAQTRCQMKHNNHD